MDDYNTPPEVNPVDLWYKTGRTQQELAELFGVHCTTFARWCSGKTKPSQSHRRLAAELAHQLLNCQ